MSEEQSVVEKGKISLDKNILLSIVNLATKEIKGVASLSNKNMNAFKRLFCKNNYEGVKISFDKNGSLKVDVYINVYVHESVPEIAYKIQENIKNNLASMIEIKTSRINVHVDKVICEK